MPRVGGSGSFSGRPGGNIYAPVRTPQQTRLSQAERDIGLPNSYPRAPTRNPQPQRFAQPPPGRSDHRQSMKFTPWVLNLESETHKCADLNLFREPKPQPPASMASSNGGGGQGTITQPGRLRQESSNLGGTPTRTSPPRRNPLRRGTVALPILPGPKRRMPFFDVSVMTLSNVLYTPGRPHSELSWKLLQQQGFTRHVLHEDHMHDITHRSGRANERQYVDGANRMRIAGGMILLEGAPRPGLNAAGGRRFTAPLPGQRDSRKCDRLDKEGSVIRHPSLPGVDLLWCLYDTFMNPGVISVSMTAAAMVDIKAWSLGVERGIVGRSAALNARDPNGQPVGWVIRYGGRGPDEAVTEGDAEDLFRKIVQVGLLGGEDLVRRMGGLSLQGS